MKVLNNFEQLTQSLKHNFLARKTRLFYPQRKIDRYDFTFRRPKVHLFHFNFQTIFIEGKAHRSPDPKFNLWTRNQYRFYSHLRSLRNPRFHYYQLPMNLWNSKRSILVESRVYDIRPWLFTGALGDERRASRRLAEKSRLGLAIGLSRPVTAFDALISVLPFWISWAESVSWRVTNCVRSFVLLHTQKDRLKLWNARVRTLGRAIDRRARTSPRRKRYAPCA